MKFKIWPLALALYLLSINSTLAFSPTCSSDDDCDNFASCSYGKCNQLTGKCAENFSWCEKSAGICIDGECILKAKNKKKISPTNITSKTTDVSLKDKDNQEAYEVWDL